MHRKVRRTNAAIKHINHRLLHLCQEVLTTDVDGEVVGQVIACNTTVVCLDTKAIRLSRHALRKNRHREVRALRLLRKDLLTVSAKLHKLKQPTPPTPNPNPTVTPTVTPTPSPSTAPTPTPQDSVNVLSCGAIAGDGRDDGPAFTAAFRSGKPVYVPAGVYDADSLTVPAGATLFGDGAASWVRASCMFSSDVTLRNLRIGDTGDSHGPAVRATKNILLQGVHIRGGGSGGGIIGWNNRAVNNLTFDSCTFERNQGVWASHGGSGALWFAVDTGDGTIIRDVTIRNCHFLDQPTYGIVFWQSEEAGNGWWGDVLIEGNVFEVTAEFTLDFDGLEQRDAGHNNVIIRDNVLKGCGLPHAGGNAAWPYTICVEPTRAGTVIERNVIGKGRVSGVKLTKSSTDTVVRNNTFDYRSDNGVALYYADFFRTISVFPGCTGNKVSGNRILLPASPAVSANVIANEGGGTNTVSGNTIVR